MNTSEIFVVRFLSLVLATGAAAARLSAQDVLTLADCIRLAQSSQSAITLARQETGIAALGLTQARAGFLPQVHLANGYSYNSPSRTGPEDFSFIALNGVREYASQITAVEEFDTSGRLRAELQRARADRDAADTNLRITERDLKRAVTAAYYRLVLARRLVAVNRDSLAEARSFENRTRLLAENGEAAAADVVKASAEVAFLEQAQRAAELEAELANHELAAFWTREVSDPLRVEDTLDRPPAPPESLPVGAAAAAGGPFMRRLEFDLLAAQRRAFRAEARGARAALLPQASFVFQYGFDSLQLSLRNRGYAAFVNLNIPVFDWLKTRGLARQFDLRTAQVDTNRQIAIRNFSRDYQNAASRVRLIYDQIAFAGAQVRLSEENLRLSRLRYEGGEGSALDVVSAQSQLTQARSNHYTALANYLNARAELEVAAGL